MKIYGTDYKGLVDELANERSKGKKIVMASGTFDLFHIGHMRMLAAAKQKGDILIVAVKSDRAASLKKEYPPVLNEKMRMETIENGCASADYIIMADYDPYRPVQFPFENVGSYEWLNMFTPIISEVCPEYFVHEDNPVLTNARQQLFSTYDVQGIIQPRTEGISTTEIIDKIETRLLLKRQEDNK